jgi:hypothetical protein
MSVDREARSHRRSAHALRARAGLRGAREAKHVAIEFFLVTSSAHSLARDALDALREPFSESSR